MSDNKQEPETWRKIFGVPEKEELIEDISCAVMKRNFPYHGRMYLSTSHIFFSSNLFGSVTKIKINHSEVTSTKKITVNIINSAIEISTWRHQYVFASFLQRDKAFDSIESVLQRSKNESNAEDNRSRSGLDTQKSNCEFSEGGWSSDESESIIDDSIIHEFNPESVVLEPHPLNSNSQALFKESFPISVYQCKELLTGDVSSSFWSIYMDETLRSDYIYGDWNNPSNGKQFREVTCIQNGIVSPPLVPGIPKSTRCIELHRLTVRSGYNITLDVNVQTPDILYGDCFAAEVRYEVYAKEGPPTTISWKGKNVTINLSHCVIDASIVIIWTKSTQYLVRAAIERMVVGQAKGNHIKFVELFKQHIAKNVGEGTSSPIALLPTNSKVTSRKSSVVSKENLNSSGPNSEQNSSNSSPSQTGNSLTSDPPQLSLKSALSGQSQSQYSSTSSQPTSTTTTTTTTTTTILPPKQQQQQQQQQTQQQTQQPTSVTSQIKKPKESFSVPQKNVEKVTPTTTITSSSNSSSSSSSESFSLNRNKKFEQLLMILFFIFVIVCFLIFYELREIRNLLEERILKASLEAANNLKKEI